MMISSPPARRRPGWRMVLVPTLGAQLLAPLAVLEELLTESGRVGGGGRRCFTPGPASAVAAGAAGQPGGVARGTAAARRPHAQPVPQA
jgi:hypothetical protein